MSDPFIQSAIHTVRIWKKRREYKDRCPLMDSDITAHVRDLWPNLDDARVQAVVEGAQRVIPDTVENLYRAWYDMDAAAYVICYTTPANMTKAAERLNAARLKMRDAVWAVAREAGQ